MKKCLQGSAGPQLVYMNIKNGDKTLKKYTNRTLPAKFELLLVELRVS